MSDFIRRIEACERSLRIGTVRDAEDRLDLRYATMLPGGEPAKRWVLFANGRTEWIEKYAYLAVDLGLPPGTGFLTWDHRGQGASGGARAYVADYDQYARDARRIADHVTGGAPYVLLTHSMGGLIGLYAVLTGQLNPRSLVMGSPLLGLPRRPIPHVVARPLATALTSLWLGPVSSGVGSFTEARFARNPLTHHALLYKRMKASPYPVPGATFGWVAATFRAIEVVFDPGALSRLTVPTLLLGGAEESVVDPDAFRAWVQAAAAAAKAEVQMRIFPGARHELYSELDEYYRPALNATREWLLKGLGV